MTLEDLLFDSSCSNEPIHETIFLLAVSPDSCEGLLISGRIPVWVEKNEAIGADEIETAAASFTAEEEDKLLTLRVVELVD